MIVFGQCKSLCFFLLFNFFNKGLFELLGRGLESGGGCDVVMVDSLFFGVGKVDLFKECEVVMGCGKIEIKKIENFISRQVIFFKRCGGLFKKVYELVVFCDVDVVFIIFFSIGKLFEFVSLGRQDDYVDFFSGMILIFFLWDVFFFDLQFKFCQMFQFDYGLIVFNYQLKY